MNTPRSPRIGATVQHRDTKQFGKIAKVSRWLRRPGQWPVQFGDEPVRNVDIRKLQIVTGFIRSKGETT